MSLHHNPLSRRRMLVLSAGLGGVRGEARRVVHHFSYVLVLACRR